MFGTILKKLRLEKTLTQEELGKALGVSDRTVGMYEQGRREPDIETLKNIATYFDVSVDYLLGRTEIRKAKVFEADIDGKHYELEFEDESVSLTEAELKKVILQLKEVGFDVNKLIEKAKKES